jgi:hypothetical protein
MKIDPVLEETIRDTVQNSGQTHDVAKLISNWYDQVIIGNEVLDGESIANRNTAFSHLERIFESMWSPNSGE